MSPRLLGSPRPLAEVYDVALLDLDGVVYVGERPVPAAPESLAAARSAGMRLAFVTNNASRTAQAVADRLTAMGVPAVADEVTTSAQAAAHHLADLLPAAAAVLVVGGEGLRQAVDERGLRAVATALDPDTGEPVAAVVQGFSPEVGWSALAEAAVAVRAGARWVATNLDATIPSERGPLPGNGSLVHVLSFAFGMQPESTGKPDPTMHRESVERSGAQRPVVVGDRLDTDIEGAVRVGAPSLLVLSGVTNERGLLDAARGERPDHVARDVGGLLSTHPEVDWSTADARSLGRWRAHLEDSTVVLASTGAASGGDAGGDGAGEGGDGGADGVGDAAGDDALDALRLVTPAVWRCRDEVAAGREPGQEDDEVRAVDVLRAADADAAAVIRGWGLDVERR